MKTVAIAGASGVVGRQVLARLLAHPAVEAVVAVGRRPPATAHPKLTVRGVEFGAQERIVAAFPEGLDVAFCCLGTTIRQAGSQSAFRAIDREAVVAFAAAARERGARRFVLLSSIGADPSTRNFYLRTKGEAEQAVRALGFPQLTILRPSLLDDEGTREEFRLGERLLLPVLRAVFAVVGRNHRYAPVRVSELADRMIVLAENETSAAVRVVEGLG
jgi:uncharacterized protein YbjT (DUF2867 family)